jgi:glutamate synthase (NADPH/NADH) small chain
LTDLRANFDAVYLGFGLAAPVRLNLPGENSAGVHSACSFILNAFAPPSSDPVETIDVRRKQVVVLGGGDTAMDALRIAIRQGAASALCIYRRGAAELPADADEYNNAIEEGARFLFHTQPSAILANADGTVRSVQCVRTEPGETDATARPRPVAVKGSEFEVPADVVLVAYGFAAPELPPSDDFAKLATTEQGHVAVDAVHMTNLPGVFAGGSIVRGAAPLSVVVRDARATAEAMDCYLSR